MTNKIQAAAVDDPQFKALQQISATVGDDASLVQGAGGNTSLKVGGVMWIKASGTWLKNAQQADQFVPVEIDPLMNAIENNDPRAEKSVDFVLQALNPSGLRPSIETTVHALLPHRVVIHVHCIKTISLAVQIEGETQLNSLLADFDWSWIPYTRPGLSLAKSIQRHKSPEANILVLGNHGLVVAADTVNAASTLLQQVVDALTITPRTPKPADLAALKQRALHSKYRLPAHPATHAVACDDTALKIASGGSLYPDHVIFIGAGSIIARDNETASEVAERSIKSGLPEPVSILFPTLGVLMRDDANPGQEALARCLSDVCLHIPPGRAINHFNASQNNELLNWEAEAYRQTLKI